jgi:hypothetical protein
LVTVRFIHRHVYFLATVMSSTPGGSLLQGSAKSAGGDVAGNLKKAAGDAQGELATLESSPCPQMLCAFLLLPSQFLRSGAKRQDRRRNKPNDLLQNA